MITRIKTDIALEPLLAKDFKNFIKFDDDNIEEEQLISAMISAARAHFEKRTGLSFAQRTFETQFKYDDQPFILPRYPVISVDNVETVDYLGAKTGLTLNSDYYKSGLYEVEIITDFAGWPNPWKSSSDYNDLLVTYKAGFGHADTEALPADLLEALKKQVLQWYENRDDFKEFNILGSIDKILLSHTRLLL